MANYKKTFWGAVVAFFIGTSCCWMSALAVWIGGATVLGLVSSFFESIQGAILVVGGFLALLSIFLYFRAAKR